MTRAKRADALLLVARQWQNDECADNCTAKNEILGIPELWDEEPQMTCWFDMLASAALSEASALGFALVNADGSDCEKVARYAPAGGVRRGDGTTFALYERARRCS
jgi:hypothetical protein